MPSWERKTRREVIIGSFTQYVKVVGTSVDKKKKGKKKTD